jgi:glucan phosphoethanolaminetransferase (alkaline phosphatase superfamily)
LDKDQQLVTGILEALAETHARLLQAPLILPYMFDFLGVLYFVRKLWQEVTITHSLISSVLSMAYRFSFQTLNSDVLKKIISTNSIESKSYGAVPLLASLHPFVRYLYSPTGMLSLFIYFYIC